MLAAAVMGARCSRCCCPSASINLRADQTIGGTALNLLAPALCSVLRAHHRKNREHSPNAGGRRRKLVYDKEDPPSALIRTPTSGFLGNTLLHKVYLATYICIVLFIVLSIILYKTKFGLRLRACGEKSPGC